MVTIEEAKKIISDQIISLHTEMKTLDDCLNFSIAETILAPFDMPSFDNSAMDGYALCGTYKTYTLVGEVAAGAAAEMILKEQQAVRIFTGAKVPENTTAVMMQERTSVNTNQLTLEQVPKAGLNIRKQGGEFAEGDLVFEKSYTITPAAIGLLGSLGIENVQVYKKPRLHIITTGNELVAPGKARSEGQIYESNSYALASACVQFGFKCPEKVQIADDFEAIKAGIAKALKNTDVLILSGGISVGDYDFVKQALEENGVQEQFYKVFQKPGKPLYFGKKEDTYIFALPGNPASSLSCFYMFVLPFLYQLSGSHKTGLIQFGFPIAHDFENKTDRPSFLKASIANEEVSVLDAQGSSMLKTMALGNALAFVGAKSSLKTGDCIPCYLIL